MTRVTNFGIKRTHMQAGFSSDGVAESAREGGNEDSETGRNAEQEGPPRKRRRNRKRKLNKADVGAMEEAGERKKTQVQNPETSNSAGKATLGKRNKDGQDKNARRHASSESRRMKRVRERTADTTCFICREIGHTAKYCEMIAMEVGKSVVGICYRCGSTRHNLSRCKKPIDELHPLPYASCFVCHGKGHLASSCPQNKDKGIYPNGGCCKLCGDTSHLAKDCGLRRQDSMKTSMVVGAGEEAGADEDDFHILNRKKGEVDQEERTGKKRKCLMDATVGAKAKAKVVHF